MKAISPFVAIVIAIAITIVVGSILAAWSAGFFATQTRVMGAEVAERLLCEQASGIRVDEQSIRCNFTGTTDYLNFTLENRGTIELWRLRAEVYLQGAVESFELVDAITEQNFTESNPLKPGEARSVKALIGKDLAAADPQWLRVYSVRCPGTVDRMERLKCT